MNVNKEKLFDESQDALEKTLNAADTVEDKLAVITEQELKLEKALESTIERQKLLDEKIATISPAISAITTNPMAEVLQSLTQNKVVMGLGELAIKKAIPTYQFETPTLKAIDKLSTVAVTNMASGLITLAQSPAIKELQALTSTFGQWLQKIDYTPLTAVLRTAPNLDSDLDIAELEEAYLKAMFDARWFPYAGWFVDYGMVGDIVEILKEDEKSDARTEKIDAQIFAYYDNELIEDFKDEWQLLDLPPYMERILKESINAYLREEYALTISALVTLWEGIIQEKMNDDKYRVSKRTRQNLTQLIKENEYDDVFSSFCEEFIFYDCFKPDDVKDDVPGRHGIAHGWYNTYPNKKVALNAILFTDFLLRLTPLDAADNQNSEINEV